jgi:hypothetical protein
VRVVPVFNPANDNEVRDTVREAVTAGGRGACIRLTGDNLDVDQLPRAVERALHALSQEPATVDLVLDFQEILKSRARRDLRASLDALRLVATIGPWRSLTWAGTAFPKNLAAFEGNTKGGKIERTEWKLWLEMVQTALPRLPTFGDYAIAHPALATFDPKKMPLSASARYTIEEAWLIWKGRSLKKYGSEQFNAISKDLIAQPDYKGSGFSWGDRIIQRCAMGGPSGNHEVWRKIGTSHHLELVVWQLANLPGLSAVA